MHRNAISVSVPEPPASSRRERLRVLCVDDEPMYREVLKHLFAMNGCIVEVACDGVAALEKIAMQQEPYDVLVTDHNMPRMTGLELVSRMREAGAAYRVVVHSGGLVPDVVKAYSELGVDRIVCKGSPHGCLIRTH